MEQWFGQFANRKSGEAVTNKVSISLKPL